MDITPSQSDEAWRKQLVKFRRNALRNPKDSEFVLQPGIVPLYSNHFTFKSNQLQENKIRSKTREKLERRLSKIESNIEKMGKEISDTRTSVRETKSHHMQNGVSQYYNHVVSENLKLY